MNEELLDRYRLRWNDVKYEPGELRVVVYDKDGRQADEKTIRTAGIPVAFKLESDRQKLSADGDDMAFIIVSMVDADGNEVPDATDELSFEVTGQGKFQAVCNGDATSLEPFTQPQMRLFSGKLVVVVRSTEQKGTMRLTVRDMEKGSTIPDATCELKVEE